MLTTMLYVWRVVELFGGDGDNDYERDMTNPMFGVMSRNEVKMPLQRTVATLVNFIGRAIHISCQPNLGGFSIVIMTSDM